MSVYKDSLQYAILVASAGALLLPVVDYLDNSITPLYYSAAIGAASGFVLGGGAGIMLNSTSNGKIAPLTVALPSLTAGGTALVLKVNPKTSSMSYKRLIGVTTIAGIAGLLTGVVIQNQRNR